MIDQNKRTTLKLMSGAAATAAVPALLASAASAASTTSTANAASVALPGTGVVLSFSPPSVAGGQTVTITNTTDQLVSLKHVYPGIVKVGEQCFDVNQLLDRGACAVTGGQSRTLPIEPVSLDSVERRIPAGLNRRDAVQVSSAYRTFDGERTVSTTRSIFS